VNLSCSFDPPFLYLVYLLDITFGLFIFIVATGGRGEVSAVIHVLPFASHFQNIAMNPLNWSYSANCLFIFYFL
jgi:hypothetical protein